LYNYRMYSITNRPYPGNTLHSVNLGVYLTLTVVLLSACASTVQRPTARVEDRSVQRESSGKVNSDQNDKSTPYVDRRYHIERAEHFEKLANRDSNTVAEQYSVSIARSQTIDAALSSAEFYLQAEELLRAQQAIASLQPQQLSEAQNDRFEIVSAWVEYSKQEYRVALNRLSRLLLQPRFVDQQANQQAVDAWLLTSFCHQALNDYDQAVAALIQREALLVGKARAETSRYIWQVINDLGAEQRQAILQTTTNPVVRNRFEQSMHGQIGSHALMPNQFDQWRRQSSNVANNILEGKWSARAPKSIAVLLPITSRFNKAAQAVSDGIQYQHSLNNSIYKPRVDVYDIGDDPQQVGQYYNAAMQNGAELVIGPLGKEYANFLNYLHLGRYDKDRYTQSNLSPGVSRPLILLGGDQPLQKGVHRFTMSPERDARIVADRAFANGYVNAALLVPLSANGQRSADAFTRYWLANGGKLSKTIAYSPKQYDHSTEMKQLFDINQSEYRHNRISQTLGYKPKYASYRRNDIDFVFMIADNDAGRIVRPQINFFGGSSVPVLASSTVYNGIQDPTNNIDLDKTSFPVMPWVLIAQDVAPYAGQLNMLFAMGADAYRLAANLPELRNDPSLFMQGHTGMLNIDPAGEVIGQPIWARFIQGTAQTETELEYLTPPASETDSESPTNMTDQLQGGIPTYDESNWDTRQSRRKPGS